MKYRPPRPSSSLRSTTLLEVLMVGRPPGEFGGWRMGDDNHLCLLRAGDAGSEEP